MSSPRAAPRTWRSTVSVSGMSLASPTRIPGGGAAGFGVPTAVTNGFDYTLIAGPPQVQRTFALCGLDRTLAFAA